MKTYRNLYFDLDRTLWDFEANSRETLQDIYQDYQLYNYFNDFDVFFITYLRINEKLWDGYRLGSIKKDFLRTHRFNATLETVGINDEALAEKIGNEYIEKSPLKTQLFEGAIELLEYLKPKYKLYIITNGFKEVQHIKLQKCGLTHFFDKVFISEEIGYSKPRPETFHYAISSVQSLKEESLMIGDDLEIDILGAKKYGIDQVYFNPSHIPHNERITFEVASLLEIKNFL